MNNEEKGTAASGSVSGGTAANPLIENIKQWVYYDNQLKLLTEKMRDIREKRGRTQETIIDELNTSNRQNAVIGIGDGELKMCARKDYPPLTYHYVEKCLTDVIPNQEHVKYIINYMKSNREIKESFELRRTQKKI